MTPFICAAENSIQKKRESRRQRQIKRYWPQYKGCQDMPRQPFFMEDYSSKPDTEARAICDFHCQKFLSPFGLFKKMTHSIIETDFKKQLKERVLFQIDSKIVEIRLLKACVIEDKKYLLSLGTPELKEILEKQGYSFNNTWTEIKKACQRHTNKLRSSIEKLWPDMAVHLSLSSPAVLNNKILSDPLTWLDRSPSHKISSFGRIPTLSPSELKRAKEIYIEALTKAYKENYKFSAYSFSQYGQIASDPKNDIRSQYRFTPEELRKHLREGKLLYRGRKSLSLEDQFHLKTAIRDLRKQSKQNYLEVISEMPLLGYLESGAPDRKQLAKAFSKVEKNLQEFSDEIKEKDDMDLLLSFEPLVEELLKESQLDNEDNSPYCLIAERARLKSEKAKESKEKLLTGAMLALLVPCLMGGGISISICITGEALLGTWEISQASLAAKHSFSGVLIGKQFEKISKLEEKQKELKMAQWMFPLLFLEAGIAIKAGKQLRKSEKEVKK